MVARVKAEAIHGPYDNMETSEEQNDVYRNNTARDRAGKYIGPKKQEQSKMQQERLIHEREPVFQLAQWFRGNP